jgi:hypothetical protein
MLRGYVLHSRRSAASTQEKALSEAGVTVVYVEGKNQMTFNDLFRSLRPGDGLAVMRLSDLANDRRELQRRVKATHDKGCYIHEQSTGRDSRKPTQLAEMIFEATDRLAQVRKGHSPKKAREFGSRGGRPGFEWTDAQRAMIEKHWYDMRHPLNSDAVAAINEELKPAKRKVNVHYVWRMMQKKYGDEKAGSGRQTGPRRKIVTKRRRRT